jgi:hypothetical protein
MDKREWRGRGGAKERGEGGKERKKEKKSEEEGIG